MTVTINGTTGIAGTNGSAGTPAVQGEDTNTGIFFPAADTIAFAEGGAEVARFDSSGNLGIGTTSIPSGRRLAVSGGSVRLDSDYQIEWGGSTAGLYGNGANNTLHFFTNTTERARIDASGNLLVGTTTNPDSGRFYVQAGTGYAAVLRNVANGICQLTRAINNNTTEIALGVYSEALPNWVTYIYSNGNIVNRNNSYGALSDAKLKENIVDSGSQWDDIKAIRVRKYSMKDDGLDAPNMIGVVAQEVEAAGMGGLVFESPDLGPDNQPTGEVTKQVNYSILYMKAVKALQEAMTRIEALEVEVAALKEAAQ
jgi:hypothetical protein